MLALINRMTQVLCAGPVHVAFRYPGMTKLIVDEKQLPFYNDLRPQADNEKRDYALVFPAMTDTEKRRAIFSLLRLKSALATEIPARKADENLLMASWNIKEFGHTTQRLYESYFYIAEVISRFDLVVVQEIKSTLKGLNEMIREPN